MLIDSLLLQILEAMITTANPGTDFCGIRDLISLEEILSSEINKILNKKFISLTISCLFFEIHFAYSRR